MSTSIVYKLNMRLFFRFLSAFIAVDLLICLLILLGGMVIQKQSAEDLLGYYERDALLSGEFAGAEDIRFSEKAFPNSFLQLDMKQPGIRGKLLSLEYRFALVDQKGQETYAAMGMKDYLQAFFNLFLILLIIEVFMLVSLLFKNARTVKRYLRPLEELAMAANALNSSVEAPDYLQKIAGALESIDADRLDTRIPLASAKDELKSLTVAINGMLDRIDEAYKLQMRFVSDASHELRTPIAVIQGYADLLDRWGKADPETLQEAISNIKSEASSMKEMVEQLLFLARGDNQTMHLTFEEIDLSALAREVFSEIEMIDKTHRLECRLPEDGEPVMAAVDKGLIKQLMRILMDNSIKYTPADGKVILSVKMEEEMALFSVQDEGIGIAEDALPFVFDRFFRADESRTRKTGGTGLGLSIAKWIVERHQGKMDILTRENIGSRFSVYLPAHLLTDQN